MIKKNVAQATSMANRFRPRFIIADFQLPIFDLALSIADCRVRQIGNRQSTIENAPIHYCRFSIADFRSRVCQLPIADCQLPIAECAKLAIGNRQSKMP
jgi:hypothetical protein